MSILVEIFVLIPLRRITKIILRRLVLRGKGFSSLCVSLQSRKMHLIAQGNKNLESLIMIFILPLEMLKWQLHSVHHWFNLVSKTFYQDMFVYRIKAFWKAVFVALWKYCILRKKQILMTSSITQFFINFFPLTNCLPLYGFVCSLLLFHYIIKPLDR